MGGREFRTGREREDGFGCLTVVGDQVTLATSRSRCVAEDGHFDWNMEGGLFGSTSEARKP